MWFVFTQGCDGVSLPHFFLEDQVIAQEQDAEFIVRMTKEDARHARVLRLMPGEHIALIDAANDYFECEIVSVTPNDLRARVAQHLEAPLRPQVVLMQGLAKGEKMDMVIRHATELGVAGIVPLTCERSVVKLDKKKATTRHARWCSIAKSAAMQSGRTSLPFVTSPLAPHEAMQYLQEATAVLVCWEEAPLTATIPQALSNAIAQVQVSASDARVVVVVGPEGGLTEEEVALLLRGNEHSSLISLGPSILRTETAGIVAPALVLYELEAHL